LQGIALNSWNTNRGHFNAMVVPDPDNRSRLAGELRDPDVEKRWTNIHRQLQHHTTKDKLKHNDIVIINIIYVNHISWIINRCVPITS
jgi:hypothetical protein